MVCGWATKAWLEEGGTRWWDKRLAGWDNQEGGTRGWDKTECT